MGISYFKKTDETRRQCFFVVPKLISFRTIWCISNTWPPPVQSPAFLLSHFDRPGCATPAFPIHSKTRAYRCPIKRCPSAGDGGGSPHRAVDRRRRVPRGEGALLQVRHPDRRRLESSRGRWRRFIDNQIRRLIFIFYLPETESNFDYQQNLM